MRLACFLVFCAVLSPSTRVHALELEWRAPDGCPDANWLEREIAGRLGRARSDLASVAFQIRGRIEMAEDRASLALAIVSEDGTGERRLQGENCTALARAAAIIVALAIDPDAVDVGALEALAEAQPATTPVPGETPAAETPATPSPPASDPEPEPEPQPEPSEPIDARLLLRAEVVGDVGSLDAPALGPTAGVGVLLDRTRLEVTVAYLPPADTEISGRATPVAELRLLSAGANGCYAFMNRDVSLGPCVGLEAGNMWGRGSNLALQQRGNALWIGAIAGARGTWWLTDVAGLSLALDLGLPLLRTLFTVEGLGTVHETSGLFFRARLGLEARL